MEESSIYDVVRLDVTWLSWFAHKILLPMEEIEPDISVVLESFVEGLSRQYSYVEDTLYALPVSPSLQMLFYRRDLFESTVMQRLYHEINRAPLVPPKTFSEYNQVARFFTRALNPGSPVDYGTTLTLGSTGVAATEFLTRYFSYTDSLFTPEGKVLLTNRNALRALENIVEARQCSKDRYCAWWTNAAQEFAGGDVAMTILYSNFASEIVGPGSKIVNKVGYAVVPGKTPDHGGAAPSESPSTAKTRGSPSPTSNGSAASRYPRPSPCSGAFRSPEGPSRTTKSWTPIPGSGCRRNASPSPTITGALRRTTRPFDERRFLSFLGVEVKNAYSGVLSPPGGPGEGPAPIRG